MAKSDLGKKWEVAFKQSWKHSFPKGWVFRLNDQMTGYKETSGNPCDFICFAEGKLFLVECKEHKGASIPFTAIPQYERLLEHKDYEGVYPGVTIWFSDKDLIVWVGIKEMERMVANGEKSIGIRMLEDKSYNIVIIPSVKKRVFFDSDYTCLTHLEEQEAIENE